MIFAANFPLAGTISLVVVAVVINSVVVVVTLVLFFVVRSHVTSLSGLLIGAGLIVDGGRCLSDLEVVPAAFLVYGPSLSFDHVHVPS